MHLAAGHLGWAEIAFVMERHHTDRLREKFAEELRGKTVVILRIPDQYPFGDAQLITLLYEKLTMHLLLL